MPARHKSRQHALQVLFAWDRRQQAIDDSIAAFYLTLGTNEDDSEPVPADPFMESLARGTARSSESIDPQITQHSANWRIERMSAVDRNILRMAIHEMQAHGTPAAIAIDEALELAREFSGDESASFINGVLDAIRRANP
jgi:transcription antitermination protein NusB